MPARFKLRDQTSVSSPPDGHIDVFADKNELLLQINSVGKITPFGSGVSNVTNTSITLVETTDTASVPRPSDGEVSIYVYNNTISIINEAGTVTPVSAVLIDGDYGDITVSSTGTVLTIDANAVTYAKMQDVSATDRLLGRDTAGSGDVEELTVGGGVEFTGSGGIQRSALTGDVTASAGSGSTTIPNDTVTYAKMQNVSATSRIIGRKTAGAGDPEECTLSEILDFIGSAAQGDILYRGASGWSRLGAGAAGSLLQSAGAGANPTWAAVSGGGSSGGIYETTPSKPVASNFTLENAGTASMADGTFGLVLTMPSSTVNIRFMRYNTAPGSSFTVIMRGSMTTPYATNTIHHNSILLRNTANGRLINFAHNNANLVTQRWASYTSFNAGIATTSANYGYVTGWKKVVSDGTTLTFFTSSNGVDWGQVASETIATYIGAVDQVGIGSVNGAASSVTNIDIFESFTLS